MSSRLIPTSFCQNTKLLRSVNTNTHTGSRHQHYQLRARPCPGSEPQHVSCTSNPIFNSQTHFTPTANHITPSRENRLKPPEDRLQVSCRRSSLPSPREQSLSSSAISSSIALWDQHDAVAERWPGESARTACLEIPDVAHVEKKGGLR